MCWSVRGSKIVCVCMTFENTVFHWGLCVHNVVLLLVCVVVHLCDDGA